MRDSSLLFRAAVAALAPETLGVSRRGDAMDAIVKSQGRLKNVQHSLKYINLSKLYINCNHVDLNSEYINISDITFMIRLVSLIQILCVKVCNSQ